MWSDNKEMQLQVVDWPDHQDIDKPLMAAFESGSQHVMRPFAQAFHECYYWIWSAVDDAVRKYEEEQEEEEKEAELGLCVWVLT